MTFDDNVTAARNYMNGDRFSGITRLYSARQVAEQQGTIESGYPVARANAAAFYDLLCFGLSVTQNNSLRFRFSKDLWLSANPLMFFDFIVFIVISFFCFLGVTGNSQ